MEINTLPIIWFWWIFMQFSSVVSIKNSIFSPFHWKCVFFSQYVEKEIIICLSLWLFLSMRKCRYIYWVCPWFDRRISLSVQWKTHWSHWYYNLLPEWKKKQKYTVILLQRTDMNKRKSDLWDLHKTRWCLTMVDPFVFSLPASYTQIS